MKALIFGTGKSAEEVLDKVKIQYDIIGFLDNAISKQNIYYDERNRYMIYAPSAIVDLEYDKVIIASIKYASEMYSQLLQIGVREHDIVVDYVCKRKDVFLYDFLKMQVDTVGKMNRMDIVVKYLAIDSYIKNQEEGILLYKTMQRKRLKCSSAETDNIWKRFCTLIDSVIDKGFDRESCIVCDENMRVMDGAHRVALALYFEIDMLPIKMTPQSYICNYGVEWFWEQGFSRQQICWLTDMENELFHSQTMYEMMAFIWPPAMKYADEIKEDLSYLTKIVYSCKRSFVTKEELKEFVYMVYASDDIADWKIDKKIEHIVESENEIEVLFLYIDEPSYRLKGISGLPISMKIEQIKKIIRSRYQIIIDEYFYDNIIHITDNYCQTKVVQKFMELSGGIKDFFEEIKKEKYVLTKLEVPYMPMEFPRKYPIGKDMDIICSKDSFQEIIAAADKFIADYAKQYGLYVKRITKPNRIKIRMEYLNTLVLQFDIAYSMENIKDSFVEEMLNNRVENNGFYMPRREDEVVIRINELQLHPDKKHHAEYLSHIEVDENRIRNALVRYYLN